MASRKVKGVCVVCRKDVSDARRHYISQSHLDRVAAYDRARAKARALLEAERAAAEPEAE